MDEVRLSFRERSRLSDNVVSAPYTPQVSTHVFYTMPSLIIPVICHYSLIYVPIHYSAAAWDTVEELSAAASHAKESAKEDPLEKFCEEDPSADECRVYED